MITRTALLSSLAAVVLIALVAAGCGGGSDSGSSKVYTTANGQELTVPEMVDLLVEKSPEALSRLCQVVDQFGHDAALASFEQGFKLSKAGGLLPPEEVFNEVVKHC